jgi:spermidine synthase
VRIERTRRGARIVEDDVVLSEILARPGPTHSLFDVLAAAVAVFAPGPRFAMLGFAGGGMIAPLRAMGCPFPVHAVDLSREAEPLFRELSTDWSGDVALDADDADAWLRKRRGGFDVIVEDLSVPSPVGTIKPYVSFATLPERIRSGLRPGGVAIINLLPLPGTEWEAMYARVSSGYRRAIAVHLADYENRILLAGDALPEARESGRRLREPLRAIGSDMQRQLRLRTIRFD